MSQTIARHSVAAVRMRKNPIVRHSLSNRSATAWAAKLPVLSRAARESAKQKNSSCHPVNASSTLRLRLLTYIPLVPRRLNIVSIQLRQLDICAVRHHIRIVVTCKKKRRHCCRKISNSSLLPQPLVDMVRRAPLRGCIRYNRLMRAMGRSNIHHRAQDNSSNHLSRCLNVQEASHLIMEQKSFLFRVASSTIRMGEADSKATGPRPRAAVVQMAIVDQLRSHRAASCLRLVYV